MEPTRTSALSRDTTPESLRAQVTALRRLGLSGRARLTFELSEGLRQTVEAGVRYRHPEYDERTARLAATRLAIGDDLFRRVFPGVDVKP